MREIKFRVFIKETETIEEVTSMNFVDEDLFHVYVGDLDKVLYSFNGGFSLLQYTGLKDKNGRDIYEGDIFEITFDQDVYHEELGDITIQRKDKEVVRFVNGCFKLGHFPLSQVIKNKKYVKLIGNIYENPELMEG